MGRIAVSGTSEYYKAEQIEEDKSGETSSRTEETRNT